MLNEGAAWAKLSADALIEHHPMAVRVFALAAIFLFGYLEGPIFKQRTVACATWFSGLGALVAWIAYPLTINRICAGTVVFVSGLVLLTLYYKRWARETRVSGPL